MNNLQLSISKGNSKMGDIASVSLLPIVTCDRLCECTKNKDIKCFASKIAKLRKSVYDAWKRNTDIYMYHRDLYWQQVEVAIACNRVFRFHVSGDMPDRDYIFNVIRLANKYPSCDIIIFTKRYEWVNKALDAIGSYPNNLHLLFSVWKNFPCDNKYSIPEAHILYKDGFTTAKDGAKWCNGNCTTCFLENDGCFSLKKGEQVIFKQH